jgi:hypothetical protein
MSLISSILFIIIVYLQLISKQTIYLNKNIINKMNKELISSKPKKNKLSTKLEKSVKKLTNITKRYYSTKNLDTLNILNNINKTETKFNLIESFYKTIYIEMLKYNIN